MNRARFLLAALTLLSGHGVLARLDCFEAAGPRIARSDEPGRRARRVEALLPHRLAPDVYALAAPHRFGSATVGWISLEDEAVLVDCPHPDYLPKVLAKVESTTGKPLSRVILTHSRSAQLDAAWELLKRGVRVYAAAPAAAELARRLASEGLRAAAAERVERVGQAASIRVGGVAIELCPLGHAAGPGDLAAWLPRRRVLFAGEVCANGPKNDFARGRNKPWIEAIRRLEAFSPSVVVPGFGGVGGPELLRRQRELLVEFRRRVSYLITQSKPRDVVVRQLTLHTGVSLSPRLLAWFPYDAPKPADIGHVYDELTAPRSPYQNEPFDPADRRPRALALIGDRVHDPADIEEYLGRAFSDAGVAVRFAFDVRTLSAENLAQVDLFCILRDGWHWPDASGKPSVWMTPEQENALVEFVRKGGALLGLHNCTGLYPEGGAYLELLGGVYKGHGPLERFRVAVCDPAHPIARGVRAFEVADEQHTPVPDTDKVRIFLKSYSEQGVEAAAGWAYQFGDGRVAYLANGHTREALAHPMVQRLMRNAIAWCLRRGPDEAAN